MIKKTKKMEKRTKIILGVLAVAGVAYLTRDMWIPKKESIKKDTDKKSEFLGISSKKNKKRDSDKGTTNTILGGIPQCVTTCEYTNPNNGSVSTYDGACNKPKANQGWVTITRCSGGGSNAIMSAI